MHIALVTHYFPPEVNAPAQRAFDHARAWVEAGCEVTVVTAAPSHPYGRLYDGYQNRTGEEIVDGVRVLRLRTRLGANAGKLPRVRNYLSFYTAARRNAWRIGPADVVLSTSPQFFCGLAGHPIARRSKAAWVFEVRDIWPESIVAVGAARPSPLISAVARLADWAYRRSDMIVSVSPGFAEHFAARGVPAEKVALIPNGVDASLAPAAADFSAFPELAPLEGRFIAAYVGTFGMAHGADTILRAAGVLKDQAHIGFVLAGSGAERDNLHALKAELGLPNLVLLDQLPRDRVAQLWSLASASIVHLKDQDVFRTVIPTKLLEGMAMAKPILLGVRGQAQTILEAGQAGRAFAPENPSELADAVLALAADPSEAERCGRSGRAYVLREFDRRTNALRLLEQMRELAARKAKGGAA